MKERLAIIDEEIATFRKKAGLAMTLCNYDFDMKKGYMQTKKLLRVKY